MNKREEGAKYEDIAKKYLTERGLKILEQNFRCRRGEIDLIARDGSYYVFIEVKYRSKEVSGLPEESVHRNKQRIICKVSDYYLMKNHLGDNTPVRYDVVAIDTDIRWHKDAFPYIP